MDSIKYALKELVESVDLLLEQDTAGPLQSEFADLVDSITDDQAVIALRASVLAAVDSCLHSSMKNLQARINNL